MHKLAEIFDRMADIHGECVTEQIYGEIAVCDDIIAKSFVAEMKGEEVVYIASAFLRNGEHFASAEIFNAAKFAFIPDERRSHAVVQVKIHSGKGFLPVARKAERKTLAVKFLDEILDNVEKVGCIFSFGKFSGKNIKFMNVIIRVFDLTVHGFAEFAEIIRRNGLASAAFGKYAGSFRLLIFRLFTVEKIENNAASQTSEFGKRSCNRREGWAVIPCAERMVKSGDDNVERNAESVFFESAYSCQRHSVVSADESVGKRKSGLHVFLDSVMTVITAEFSVINAFFFNSKPVFSHNVAESVKTLDRFGI